MKAFTALVTTSVRFVTVALFLCALIASPKAAVGAGSLDIVMVVDSGGAIGATDFQTQLQFAKDLVMDPALSPDTRFSLINFATSAITEFSLPDFGNPNDPATVSQAIDSVPYLAGASHDATALQRAVDELATYSSGRAQLVFFITNGTPFPPEEHRICDSSDGFVSEALASLRAMGVPLITVGVEFNPGGFDQYTACLDDDNPGSQVVLMQDFSGLGPILATFVPELAVTKSADVEQAMPGEQIVYTISYESLNDCLATDVVVSDPLPDHVSFVTADSGGWESGGVVTWDLGNVAGLSTADLMLTVEVDALAPADSTIVNTASIDSDQTSAVESAPANVTLVAPPAPVFLRGDADANGIVDFTDAINHLKFLFLGEGEILCRDAADSDDSGDDDLTDDIFTLTVLFLGGEVFPDPGDTSCGVDPTDGDSADRATYPVELCP